METWEVVIICLLAFFIGITILMLTDIKEKIRRKKHPVWYEFYDRAKYNSFYIGSKFRRRTESIEMLRGVFKDKFFNDEYTEEVFNEAMDALEREYREAAKQFKIDKEVYGIDADLKAADAYAKEHNLKWGILYNDE